MALTRILFSSFILSLMVLASANYEYKSPQNHGINNHHKPELLDHHEHYHSHCDNLVLDQLRHNLISRKSNYVHRKPQEIQNSVPIEPISYNQKPKTEAQEHNVPATKPYHDEEQKINHDDHVHEEIIPNVTFIGIQGIILCESGPKKYLPLEGAKARITCPSSYQNGYNKAESFSIPSPRTDEHGFFLVTLSVSELRDKSINIQECRAFLEYSPLESCNDPIRNGLAGAHLSLFHTYTNKIYYNVGSLIYKSETHFSVPDYNRPAPSGY